jgi:hypothetical protein
MNTKDVVSQLCVGTRQRLMDSKMLRSFCSNPAAFSRERKLPLSRLILFLLRRMHRGSQLELDTFYEQLGYEESPVTKQALSKARKNLDYRAIKEFADMSAEAACQIDAPFLFKGMRLCAVDGSSIALENAPELREKYGTRGYGSCATTGLMSMLYDPLNDIILDAQMLRGACDERESVCAHLEQLKKISQTPALLLFDRGYPSKELMLWLNRQGYKFLMRCSSGFWQDFNEATSGDWFEIRIKKHYCNIRVIKVALSSGETELLLTNLGQQLLPCEEAGALYFQRWAIEEKFKLLKARLELESFSGRSEQTMLQDIYAAIYIANLAALMKRAIDADIAVNDACKTLRYSRHANQSRIIAKLRDRFILCFLLESDVKRNLLLQSIYDDVARFPQSFRPDRSVPRKRPRQRKHSLAYKPSL